MTRLVCSVLLFALVTVSTVHSEPHYPMIAEFTLTDDRGEPWSWRQVRGKVVIVTFGYTACPDVCPLTLNVVAQTLRQLGTAAAGVQPIFISVDGKRDRPEILHRYVKYFDPRIVGLTGSTEEIEAAERRFNVSHKTGVPLAGGRYTVDHTANLFLIDQDGAIAAIVPFGFPAEHIVRLVEVELNRESDNGP